MRIQQTTNNKQQIAKPLVNLWSFINAICAFTPGNPCSLLQQEPHKGTPQEIVFIYVSQNPVRHNWHVGLWKSMNRKISGSSGLQSSFSSKPFFQHPKGMPYSEQDRKVKDVSLDSLSQSNHPCVLPLSSRQGAEAAEVSCCGSL